MSDEGFREIQLNGKQLIFLFMAVTVVLVVTFLFGVLTGRGVRQDAAATEIASGEVAPDSGAAPPADSAPPPAPAGSSASPAPAAPATEELSYAERLLRDTPAEENLKSSTASGGRRGTRSGRSGAGRREDAGAATSCGQGKSPRGATSGAQGQRSRTRRARTTARPAHVSPGSSRRGSAVRSGGSRLRRAGGCLSRSPGC